MGMGRILYSSSHGPGCGTPLPIPLPLALIFFRGSTQGIRVVLGLISLCIDLVCRGTGPEYRVNTFYADNKNVRRPFRVQMGSEELRQRMRLLDNEIRIMRSDTERIRHESSTQVSFSTDEFPRKRRWYSAY